MFLIKGMLIKRNEQHNITIFHYFHVNFGDMNYYKNLLEENSKSKKRMVYGLFMTLFSLAWVVSSIYNHSPFNVINWLFFGTLIIGGIINILGGMGYTLERIFGDSFVKINKDEITVKAHAFQPENKALWADIKSIEYKPTRFRLTKQDGTEQRLCMRKLNYDTIQDMKTYTEAMATELKIAYRTINQ